MTKDKYVEGYCDYLSSNTCITVTYAKVSSMGYTKPQAKATRLDCEYLEECGLDSNCPIFQKAAKDETW